MAQRLTRAGVAAASMGLALLGLGMGMGNLELLVFSTVPLLLLALSLSTRPRAPRGARVLSTRALRRGDALEVDVRVASDADLTDVDAPVPEGFTLVEGSNLATRPRRVERPLRFRLRAHARGRHVFPPVVAETIDPRGLVSPRRAQLATEETVEVAARAYHPEKLRRTKRGRARMLVAEREKARLGVGSTDFRELRAYAWGDPPKSINWKATARHLSGLSREHRAGEAPLVNEYEKEARSSVLVLLDAGPALRVGTSLETGLDHGVEAATAIARLFLARGVRVGAATFGAVGAPPAVPEAGEGRMPGIERALAPGDEDAAITPSRVLQTLEPHLAGARPLLIVVTRITQEGAPELAELVRRLRALLRERRRLAPIVILDVRALVLAPAPSGGWEAARDLVTAEDAEAARELAALGARVVPWDPLAEDLATVLVRRGIA